MSYELIYDRETSCHYIKKYLTVVCFDSEPEIKLEGEDLVLYTNEFRVAIHYNKWKFYQEYESSLEDTFDYYRNVLEYHQFEYYGEPALPCYVSGYKGVGSGK